MYDSSFKKIYILSNYWQTYVNGLNISITSKLVLNYTKLLNCRPYSVSCTCSG